MVPAGFWAVPLSAIRSAQGPVSAAGKVVLLGGDFLETPPASAPLPNCFLFLKEGRKRFASTKRSGSGFGAASAPNPVFAAGLAKPRRD